MNDISSTTPAPVAAPDVGCDTNGHLEQWIIDALTKGVESTEAATGLMFAATTNDQGEFVVSLHDQAVLNNVGVIALREKFGE